MFELFVALIKVVLSIDVVFPEFGKVVFSVEVAFSVDVVLSVDVVFSEFNKVVLSVNVVFPALGKVVFSVDVFSKFNKVVLSVDVVFSAFNKVVLSINVVFSGGFVVVVGLLELFDVVVEDSIEPFKVVDKLPTDVLMFDTSSSGLKIIFAFKNLPG
jgi:hypothetical protein